MELFFLALLVLLMAFALGSGYPVAFALPGSAIITIVLAAAAGYLAEGDVDAYFHTDGPGQWLSAGVTNLRGVYWEVERDTLIAIPLFIFMGIMLQRSRIAEDLLLTMAQLFGSMPGGLGISVVFVGALLAATTGIVGATVVAMGLISLPTMLRNNYSTPLATGTIAASGTLGQIIPPSIVLIILADQLASAADQANTLRKSLHKEATGELTMPSVFDVTSTSAGEMFLGAFVPGLVLVGLYMAYILIFALLRPAAAPPVPYAGSFDRRFWGRVAVTLVPPLALIFLVLGSIIGGIATVNQAGAIGAAGALIMAGYRLKAGERSAFYPAFLAMIGLIGAGYALTFYEMNVKAIDTPEDQQGIMIGVISIVLLLIGLGWSALRTFRIEQTLQGVMIETAKTTSLVFIILLGAAMLTAAFRAFGGEELVREFLNGLPGGFWTQFVIVMAVIFFLGFFLDFIEIAVVVVPIVAPILLSDPGANVTAVWLGVMIGLNIQTSFLTPPFGFALFYLRGVAPAVVKTVQIYRGVIPFILLQIGALGIVGYYPQLVNYLPNRVSLLAETAPPPRNPKLQQCLEDYVAERVDPAALNAAIAQVQGLDLSVLSDDARDDLEDALEAATTATAGIDEIAATHKAVTDAEAGYRPVLSQVRAIEKSIRDAEAEAEVLRKRLSRAGSEAAAPQLEARIAEFEAEVEHFKGEIPSDWDEVYGAFSTLVKAEDQARATYRRNADTAYQNVVEVLTVLQATDALAAAEQTLRDLRATVENGDPEQAVEIVKGVEGVFDDIEGAGDIKSALGKARRDLRPDRLKREDAIEEYEDALATFEADLAWRQAAAPTLTEPLQDYLATLTPTLGARQQDKLSREQALYIAGCSAGHADLQLHF